MWGKTNTGEIVPVTSENKDDLVTVEVGEVAQYIVRQMKGEDSVAENKTT